MQSNSKKSVTGFKGIRHVTFTHLRTCAYAGIHIIVPQQGLRAAS